MEKNVPEINALLKKVEERYNRRISTTTDFEALSVVIEHECGDTLSASTLKRLWGYVPTSSAPRISSLDVLCRFIGLHDFKAFCQRLSETGGTDSEFFSTKYITSADIPIGAKLSLQWMPDRKIEITHIRPGRFKVDYNHNSHLQVGDEFDASSFMVGYPLFIPMVFRCGAPVSSYIAGRQHGIISFEVI